MARPKLKEAQKRVACSISVPKKIDALAGRTANKSHFYETAVECAQALALAVAELRKDRMAVRDFLDEIEDVADIWNAEFDETVTFERTTERRAKHVVRKKSNQRARA